MNGKIMAEREIRQGDVFWYDFGPARGSAPADRRPCVIVQNDTYNRSLIGRTLVCAITSNLARANDPGNVMLEVGEAGLPEASVVNITLIMTVYKAQLLERIGRVNPATMQEIRAGIHLLID